MSNQWIKCFFFRCSYPCDLNNNKHESMFMKMICSQFSSHPTPSPSSPLSLALSLVRSHDLYLNLTNAVCLIEWRSLHAAICVSYDLLFRFRLIEYWWKRRTDILLHKCDEFDSAPLRIFCVANATIFFAWIYLLITIFVIVAEQQLTELADSILYTLTHIYTYLLTSVHRRGNLELCACTFLMIRWVSRSVCCAWLLHDCIAQFYD